MSDFTHIELSDNDQAHVDLARQALAKAQTREGRYAEPWYAAGYMQATVEHLLRILDTPNHAD